MFISIQINGYMSNDPKSPDYWRRHYTLVDDEFGEVSGESASAGVGVGASAGVAAIIIEYSKRKLNVEGNLVKHLMQVCSENNWKLTKVLARFDKACPNPQYAEFAALWKTVDQTKLLKYAVFM